MAPLSQAPSGDWHHNNDDDANANLSQHNVLVIVLPASADASAANLVSRSARCFRKRAKRFGKDWRVRVLAASGYNSPIAHFGILYWISAPCGAYEEFWVFCRRATVQLVSWFLNFFFVPISLHFEGLSKHNRELGGCAACHHRRCNPHEQWVDILDMVALESIKVAGPEKM